MMSSAKVKGLPDRPGVYIFKKGSEILYIGKATSLRSRVKSYFAKDLLETRGPKIVKMLEQAAGIDFKVTDSVLEALILEAALIKKYQPIGNSDEKDGKTFNYVVITREEFPRVLVVRGSSLATSTYDLASTFGPFPHGLELREALKIIRRIFPFRDVKCTPCDLVALPLSERQGHCRPCFNRQIGLCPGVCTGEISKGEYAKVIRSISLFFQGKKQEILRGLRKHMKQAAKLRIFEKAAELRNKIFALEHINDVVLYKRNLEARRLSENERGFRIEAYDIAHISGTNTVGSMVVMEDGVLARHEYKRFKIRTHTNNDVGSFKEVLERRFKHTEWRMPDLIVIDGGRAQLAIARLAMSKEQFAICKPEIVSVVKNDKHKPDHIIGDAQIVKNYHHDILITNQEAHRFAINYHILIRDRIK
ncbi:MAG: hypothetical protein AAB590_03825 [Patescibacteria group bacterium]